MPFKLLSKMVESTLKLPLHSSTTVTMVRHAQSMGNYAGSIVGWTDSKLSVKGREQANKLFAGFHPHIKSFSHIYSSDLSRCIDTCNLSLGFPSKITTEKSLREMNFGDDEGKHFDSLPEQQKQIINSFNYQAPNGENWKQVQLRVQSFFKQLNRGHYLVYTHGGLICTQTYHLGLEDMVSNCSVVSVEIEEGTGKPKKLLWTWSFPNEESI